MRKRILVAQGSWLSLKLLTPNDIKERRLEICIALVRPLIHLEKLLIVAIVYADLLLREKIK